MTSIPRPPVYRLALVQVGLTILISALLLLVVDAVAAYSAFLGGMICTIPSGYFMWRAFKYSGARSADKVVQSFYQGEAWKFILTAIGFAVVFLRVDPVNEWALFGTFIAVQLSHVLAVKIADL